jgi:hypothetical protein
MDHAYRDKEVVGVFFVRFSCAIQLYYLTPRKQSRVRTLGRKVFNRHAVMGKPYTLVQNVQLARRAKESYLGQEGVVQYDEVLVARADPSTRPITPAVSRFCCSIASITMILLDHKCYRRNSNGKSRVARQPTLGRKVLNPIIQVPCGL